MFFAAKESVERKAMELGRQEGLRRARWEVGYREGVLAERARIKKELAELGVVLTPEIAQVLDDEAALEPPCFVSKRSFSDVLRTMWLLLK